MKKLLLVCFILVAVSFPSKSFALIINNLTFSLGEGVSIVKGEDVKRSPFNAELIPSFSLLALKLDLGIFTIFEPEFNLFVRPGVRIYPPIVYFRGALPLRVTHGFDYGFLLGIGKNIISLGIISLLIEIDTYFTKEGGFDVVPVEGRIGIDIGF